MTDFSFYGMIIFILVLVFGGIGWIAWDIVLSIKNVSSLIGSRIRNASTGYNNLPQSPPGFFNYYTNKYYIGIYANDYHLVPKGYVRDTVEMGLLNSKKKSEDKKYVAKIMAAQKEIQSGYRPTIYPNGYLKTTFDIWDLAKKRFKKEYNKTTVMYAGREEVLAQGQTNWDMIYYSNHGRFPTDD